MTMEIVLQAVVAVFFIGSLVLGFTHRRVDSIRLGVMALLVQVGLTALQFDDGARTVTWNVLIAALLALNVVLDVRKLHREVG